ncbi:hypothetical protein PG996_012001 [Apiospora saccharicola]|uniref:Uncharacterized protein n=1 Tax=Apiospora saccharicola TaxID=335842 RepID=A0ABR1U3P6_9PEZI
MLLSILRVVGTYSGEVAFDDDNGRRVVNRGDIGFRECVIGAQVRGRGAVRKAVKEVVEGLTPRCMVGFEMAVGGSHVGEPLVHGHLEPFIIGNVSPPSQPMVSLQGRLQGSYRRLPPVSRASRPKQPSLAPGKKTRACVIAAAAPIRVQPRERSS